MLLKAGINKIGGFEITPDAFIPTLIKFAGNWQIILGFFLYGLSSFLYLKILSTSEVTKIYPMLTAYMFIVLLICGSIFLKEPLTASKIIGILVIIGGIFISSK